MAETANQNYHSIYLDFPQPYPTLLKSFQVKDQMGKGPANVSVFQMQKLHCSRNPNEHFNLSLKLKAT